MKFKFTKEEIKRVESTFRATGAIGNNAIVPRVISEMIDKSNSVLDFGCGKAQIHVKRLKSLGFDVVGYDFSIPKTEKNLRKKYSVIYASNVLNVQMSIDMLHRTLDQIRSLLEPKGKVIANYPVDPRKIELTVDEMEKELEKKFKIRRIQNRNIIWEMTID